MKKGCLNHALLTQEAIKQRGLIFAGWVANRVTEEMVALEGNITTLKNYLTAPYLGTIPHCQNISSSTISQYLNIEPLLNSTAQ